MPLLHNHVMDSCSYVRKNTLLAAKGGANTPFPPPQIRHCTIGSTQSYYDFDSFPDSFPDSPPQHDNNEKKGEGFVPFCM